MQERESASRNRPNKSSRKFSLTISFLIIVSLWKRSALLHFGRENFRKLPILQLLAKMQTACTGAASPAFWESAGT